MVQSETSSQDALRDEILADARRQAERLIRKAEREAQATIDKAKARSQEARTTKLAAARAAAERKRTLTLATVPIEIGRMRGARRAGVDVATRECPRRINGSSRLRLWRDSGDTGGRGDRAHGG